MTNLLIKLFIKNSENTENEKVRNSYGVLSGMVGIFINIILTIFKILFGSITKSIAITADGINNMFDAVSSVISLVGFKISGKPADKEHPFGHGRIEYVSALVLAFLIGVTGVELIKSSWAKFTDGSEVNFTIPAAIVLVVSILMKLWLAFFNSKIGKKINSVTVDAVVKDSLGDIAATSCSLIALIASNYTSLPIDAVMGFVVSAIILFAAIDVVKSTMGPLLGEPPEKEFVEEIKDTVTAHEGILGIHDMVLHMYGHSKIMGSLHAEVSADADIMESHDLIDLIERELKEKTGAEISIHMDPILINDERTNALKNIALKAVKEISDKVSIHDFRVVDGPTHTNLIFDAVLPYSLKMKDEEFIALLSEKIKKENANYFLVINIDREYSRTE